MRKLHAEINQHRLRGGQRIPKRVVERVLQAIEKTLHLKKESTVSVAFVSEKEIRELNAAYRGKNKVTDVLSFPFEDQKSLGEVLINYEQAKRQAKQMHHSVRNEIIFLLVHGILHLYGYDHEQPRDAEKMLPLQEKILLSLGVNPRI